MTNINSTNQFRDSGGGDMIFNKIIDDFSTEIIIIVQYCVIGSLINVFGVITNIINIIIFIKQGFDETINISLLGLAVSDLVSLVFLLWAYVCFNPLVQRSDAPFSSIEIQYLTAGWPRMTLLRVTAWITAFITFERCLCITIPLKVKSLLTPRRTAVIIVGIYVILFAAVSPIYYTSRLVWKFFPEFNRTLLGLGFTQDREEIDSAMFITNNIFLPLFAYVIVIICTVTLIYKLNSKARWRETSTTQAESVSNKEKQIVKMVGLISGVFIGCFFPNAIIFFWMAREPEFNIDGEYRNIFIVSFSYCFILESINSSINIFLYHKMSSKYRETFSLLFYKTTGK